MKALALILKNLKNQIITINEGLESCKKDIETCKAAIDAINNKTTNTGDTSSGDNTSDGDTGPDSSGKSSEGTSSST